MKKVVESQTLDRAYIWFGLILVLLDNVLLCGSCFAVCVVFLSGFTSGPHIVSGHRRPMV